MRVKENLWEEPKIELLGEAKDLIKGLNPVWDAKNSLTPSDEFNAATS